MTNQPDKPDDTIEQDSPASPSKTRLKYEAHQQVKLGEDILNLKKDEIEKLALPDELNEAIQTALKIKSRSGLKRQRLYIGKLLRNLDYEIIEKQINKIKHQHDINTAVFKRLESWRDRLIENDKQVMEEVISHHPQVDRQHINQLVRHARLEQEKNKPPVRARKLFKYLQSLETGEST